MYGRWSSGCGCWEAVLILTGTGYGSRDFLGVSNLIRSPRDFQFRASDYGGFVLQARIPHDTAVECSDTMKNSGLRLWVGQKIPWLLDLWQGPLNKIQILTMRSAWKRSISAGLCDRVVRSCCADNCRLHSSQSTDSHLTDRQFRNVLADV